MTCDVCNKDDQVFVHSSSVGAMSIGSCKECLENHAEPEFSFAYLYDFVSTDGEGLAEFVNELKTYKDGKYVTWQEWKEWRQHPDRKETLDAKREKELEAMNKEEEVYYHFEMEYPDE